MKEDILEILVSEEEIQEKVTQLGEEITEMYDGKFPLVVGILKGCLPFMGDLIQKIDTHIEFDMMDVSSYGEAFVSSGEVKIVKDLNTSVAGRDILIVEDIIDSGTTLHYLVNLFHHRGAKSVKIVTLLDKPDGRTADVTADLAGFIVPDKFVVGYGLDFIEKYRNLPFVGVLKPEVYQGE